jgi:hypothetical protein
VCVRLGRFAHAVTQAAHRFDERRAELAPQTGDEYLDGVGITVEILRIDVLSKFGSRHDSAAVVHQIREHAKFMAGQLHGSAAGGNASRARVESECAATKFRLSQAARTANQSPNARQHLFDPEGLGDVIVRAAIDPLNLFVPAPSRGQNKHGHENPVFPPPSKQCEPVDFRQSQIEHNGIILLRVGKEIGLLPIGGAIDGIAGFAQRFCQLTGQKRFVFDNQNAQLHPYSAVWMNGA